MRSSFLFNRKIYHNLGGVNEVLNCAADSFFYGISHFIFALSILHQTDKYGSCVGMIECSEIRQFDKCAVRFRFTQADLPGFFTSDNISLYDVALFHNDHYHLPPQYHCELASQLIKLPLSKSQILTFYKTIKFSVFFL